MKHKYAFIISILALILPICSIATMLFLEPEFFEAIFSGLLVGCITGSVLGTVSLAINKGESKLINIFSIIPMCPLVLYLILLIPYIASK